jgi:hypothetical protein
VGITEDKLSIFRIDLFADGSGVMGYTILDEEPHVVKIKQWELRGYVIEINLGTQSYPDDLNSSISGKIAGSSMELTVGDKEWRRKVWLRPEKSVLPRLESIKEEMRRFQANGAPGTSRSGRYGRGEAVLERPPC